MDELFEKSIMLPTRYDINEYEMMENFTETIEDTRLQNQLYISLNGSGAFRRFKDTCINFDIIGDWYKFRDELNNFYCSSPYSEDGEYMCKHIAAVLYYLEENDISELEISNKKQVKKEKNKSELSKI